MKRWSQPRPWAVVVPPLAPSVSPVSLRKCRIITAVSHAAVWCQALTLPTTDPQELRQMLGLKLEELSPWPSEESAWGYLSLETGKTGTRLLLVITHRKTADAPVETLATNGISAEIVGVDALAVFRAWVRQNRLPDPAADGLFVWLENGQAALIEYERGFPLLLRSVFLPGPDDLSAEIRRTQERREWEHPGKPPSPVTIAPVSEELCLTANRLCETIGVMAKCLAPETIPTVAEALCAEATLTGGDGLNLLSEEWRHRQRTAHGRRQLAWGAVAAVVVYALTLMGVGIAYLTQWWQLQGINRQREQLQAAFDEAREVRATLTALQARIDTQQTALELLRETSLLLPPNARLTAFSFKKRQNITVRGETSSAATAAEFIGRLEHCRQFSNVKTLSMPTMQDGLTKFEVVCTLKSLGTTP